MGLRPSTDSTAGIEVAARPFSPGGALARGLSWFELSSGVRLPLIRHALLIGLGYYAGAKIGVALTLSAAAPILWPPDAVLLAGLLLTPLRSWAAVLAAALAAHLAVNAGGGVLPALAGFLSHGTGALVGALAFRRLHAGQVRPDTFRESVIFLAAAGLLAPFVSSLLDAGLTWTRRFERPSSRPRLRTSRSFRSS